ncbi:MAG: response regulator [Candidatus Margulisbacteria bacterium]|nr:response regulator [Candidatus Margulisiibacteriota bacterium]
MAKPLIMVVDDEREVTNNLVEVINQTGKYEAIAAYSGKEALALLDKNRQLMGVLGNKVKLILLDIKMPEMDGLQFLERVRKEHDEDHIGVIMVTAYEDEEKWEKSTSGFVSGYVKKPIVKDDVLGALDRFFSQPDARYDMTLETFEKHIGKKEEFKKKK